LGGVVVRRAAQAAAWPSLHRARSFCLLVVWRARWSPPPAPAP